MPEIGESLWAPLGLPAAFSWYIARLDAQRLVRSCATDIDLLAGTLEWREPDRFWAYVSEEAAAKRDAHPSWHLLFAAWRLAGEGGIQWPPSLSHLVAVEAKCAYLPRNAAEITASAVRSKKQSRQKVARLRGQIERLLKMGFDRVALLDIIANPPAYGDGVSAWLAGSGIALRSMDAMAHVLERRLPPESPAGHFVWSPAAVADGDERWQGGGAPFERQRPNANPYLSDERVSTSRSQMVGNLLTLLRTIPQPYGFPVPLRWCETCCAIHGLRTPHRSRSSEL